MTLIVFLIVFLEKVDFEKNRQMTNRHAKLPSMQMYITGKMIQNELQDEKDKSRQHREGREKPSREEMKADKHEKASKKEEKHERIKLKRSYSPERDDRDHYRERVEWEEARGSSVASNGSSHRSHNQPSPDESPRYPDERGELTLCLLDY